MTRYQRNQIDKKYRKIEERQFPEWLQIAKAKSEEPSCISPDITPPHSEQAEVLSHDTIVDFAEAQIVEALTTVQMQEKPPQLEDPLKLYVLRLHVILISLKKPNVQAHQKMRSAKHLEKIFFQVPLHCLA